MPRLIHFSAYTPAQVGSFIPFLSAILLEARGRGWEAEAVFPDQARERSWVDQLRQAGVPVHFAFGSRAELSGRIRELLGGSDEPTILHTHFSVYDIAAATVARERPNVKVFWHVHTVLSGRPRNALTNTFKFGFFGRYVERILTPSADLAAAIRRRLGARSKIEVFPSPVDPGAFPLVSPQQRDDYRRQLGVPDGVRPLLHFGRDWELKGGDAMLDALGLLAREGRPVTALVNQGGDDARAAAAQRGLEDRLIVTEMVPQPQMLYGAAEVLVAPSRGEGMPFTVVEALCSGTPVVASDLPGHRYLGDHLDACTIVPRDEPARIAAAIGAYLDLDPGGRERQGNAARDWISERLDLHRAAKKLLGEYEKALA